jgi:hypothetical protein
MRLLIDLLLQKEAMKPLFSFVLRSFS